MVCGLVIASISMAGTLLVSYGVFETKDMVARFAKQQQKSEAPSFFLQMKQALKDKNLLAFVLFLFLYQSGTMCMTSSINYVVKYVLQKESSQATPIFAGMLIGALVSILLWTQVAKHLKNNQLMLIICALFMTVFAIPLTFVQGQLAFIITMALWGLGFGGFWTFMSPAMADVVDNLVVRQQRRDDGVILGIRAFFMRFSYASQAVVFFLVHTLTKFDPDAITPLAKLGIKLHMGVIPAAFFLTGALVFAKMNRLTPEMVAKNHTALEQMDI